MYQNVSFILATFILIGTAIGQSNIDNTDKRSWSENVGWADWRGEAEPGQGVVVHASFLEGFAWAENVGWINFGDGSPQSGLFYFFDGSDAGVNVAPDGMLFGYAWGENVGWINFDGGILATPAQPARIDCDGRFDGYAWGENIGWVNLADLAPGKFVAVEDTFSPFLCDMNHDGLVDGRDIPLFVQHVLLVGPVDWRDVCSGDVESVPDQNISLDDVAAFVACLIA